MRKHQLGLFAEKLAMWFYRLRFYRILHHRFKLKSGEIDFIAQRGNQLVFAEVKARWHGICEDTLTVRQQIRIRRSAEIFLAKHPKFENHLIRFDLVVIDKTLWPKVIEDAF